MRTSPSAPPLPLQLWLPLLLFLALHLVLRLLMSPSLHKDEAELLIFNQSLAAGYSEQPPLFVWLFHVFSLACGANVFSVTLFRYLLLGGTIITLYATARLILPDTKFALLATYSFLLVPLLAWHSLTYLTHSLLFGLLAALTFHFAVLVVERGRRRDYAWLGAVIGLGLISKYNYAIFAFTLAGAGLTLRPVRERILDRRLWLAAAVAAVPVLPHAGWLLSHRDAIWATYQDKTLADRTVYLVPGVLPWGAVAVVVNMLLLGGVLLGTVVGMSPRGFFPPRDAQPRLRLYEQWLTRYFLAFGGFFVLYAVVTKSGMMHERWLEPFFLLLPLCLFCRSARGRVGVWGVRRYAAILVLVAAGLTLARCGQLWVSNKGFRGDDTTDYCFAQAARRLVDDSPAGTVIVALYPAVAGNVRQHLPHNPCVSILLPAYDPPGVEKAPRYILAWEAVNPGEIPGYFREYMARRHGHRVAPDLPIHCTTLEAVTPGGPDRPLCYAVFDPPASAETTPVAGR